MWIATLILVPTITAAAVAGVLGREAVQAVASETAGFQLPAWLEDLAPLKGRWLRLLLATPMIGLLVAATFAQVFAVTTVAVYLLLLLFTLVTGLR